jgi:hypothetical protein
MAKIPANLGSPVTTRQYSWADEARRQWGGEWSRPDVAYEMSSGRKFDSTDRYATGIYATGTTILDSIILQNQYPDAPAHLVTKSGGKIRLEQ